MKKIVHVFLLFALVVGVGSSYSPKEGSDHSRNESVILESSTKLLKEVVADVTKDEKEDDFVSPQPDTPANPLSGVLETETSDDEQWIVQKVNEPDPDSSPVISHVLVEGIELTQYTVKLEIGESVMPIVTMYPSNASDKGEIWQSSDTNIAVVNPYGNITGIAAGTCVVKVTSTDNPTVFSEVAVTVMDGNVTEPTYIDGILVVNKTYALPKDYNYGVSKDTENALQTMFSAAAADGLKLFVDSGFRSYNDQKYIYNGYVARDGAAIADTYSARAGHSEHQSGLAFDINECKLSFADSAEGKWLAENSYQYGFIIRYPKGKEDLTGYMYEPWHVRYLGVEKATEVYESGLCLEEFLGITSSYDDRP